MRQRAQVMTSILALVIGMSAVSAQEPSAGTRPCNSNDECDQLAFEQVDRRLAAFVPSVLAHIDRFAHPTTREVAKAEFAEAQRRWLAFRDRACKAEAALMFLRSAPAAYDQPAAGRAATAFLSGRST